MADHAEQVALLPRKGVLRLDLHRGGELQRQSPLGRQPALGDHPVDDVGPALAGPGRGGLAVPRVVQLGTVDDPGQVRRLGDGELAGGDAEVGLGGGLDPVRLAAEVDRVQVVLQDLILVQVPIDLQCDEELLRLAPQRAVPQVEGVLDVLLGDGGTALHGAAAGVVPGRPDDRRRRDPVVLVEGAVLGGEHRVPGRHRHLCQRHRSPVLHLEAAELGLAAGVVDDRGLRLRGLVRRRDGGRRVRGDERHHGAAEAEHGQTGDQLPGGHPASPATPAGAREVDDPAPGRWGRSVRFGPMGHSTCHDPPTS